MLVCITIVTLPEVQQMYHHAPSVYIIIVAPFGSNAKRPLAQRDDTLGSATIVMYRRAALGNETFSNTVGI